MDIPVLLAGGNLSFGMDFLKCFERDVEGQRKESTFNHVMPLLIMHLPI